MIKKIINNYNDLSQPVKASIWFLICSFLQKGISVITTPIFTRILTQTDFGNYNVYISWENIIIIIVSLNLSYGVFSQGLVKYEEDNEKFASSMQGLTLFLFIIWFIIYIIFSDFFNNLFSLDTKTMIVMFITMWLTCIFGFWAAEQRVKFKYKKLVIITLLSSVLNPLLGLVFIKIFDDCVFGRILATAIVYFVLYIGLFVVQIKRGKKIYLKKYWKYALNFNIPLIPHYLSQTVLNSSDRIMIKKMVGSAVAGIYSLAYSISLIMTIFNSSLMSTISPWMYKKIKDKKISDISNVAYGSLLLVAFVNILLIAFAPEAVAIFAPKEYYEAIYVIPPVAMSVYFMYTYDLFAKFEFYFEKTKMIALATVVGAVVNVILNYIFITKFGYIAAGYTTLVCYMIYSTFHYIMMRKICIEKFDGFIPYKTSILLMITISFLFLGFLFLFLYKYVVLRYLLIIIILLIALLKRKIIIKYLQRILFVKKIK